MTVIDLPLPPTLNNLFPTGKHGKRFRSKEYENWIEEAGWMLARHKPAKWQEPVSVLIEVREPPTRRREDVSSREKAALDLLVKHGVIEDDSQAYVRQTINRFAKGISGIRVTITPWIS